jgi:cytochrome c oxidase subunit II
VSKRERLQVLLSGAIVLASPLFACCRGVQSALDPAGPQASRITSMWWLMFWVCSAVFALVMIYLLAALYRSARGVDNSVIRPSAEAGKKAAVTGAVVLTVIILFVFLIADLLVGRGLSSLSSQSPVTIQVTGHQWWWEFKYADPVPSNIVTTANEIHIPVGQPVELITTSRDVIHSFWVPNLHGKKDLIPGQVTTTWLQADRPGVFRGQCAEFCGHQHAHMSLIVVAEEPADFYAWLESGRKPAAQPASPAEQRGQQVFLSSTCAMCHTIQGTRANGKVAPDLTHLAGRRQIAAGTLANTRDNLASWVVDSQKIKPGNKMPPHNLDSEDLQALLSYLESLK